MGRIVIAEATSNPVVGKMWARYAEVCDYVPVSSVKEANTLFSEFEPTN